MTNEQFEQLRADNAVIIKGQQDILSILLRAFAGNVKFETIVNQVRSVYDTRFANQPDSELPVSVPVNVPEAPVGGDAQAAPESGADQPGDSGATEGESGGSVAGNETTN